MYKLAFEVTLSIVMPTVELVNDEIIPNTAVFGPMNTYTERILLPVLRLQKRMQTVWISKLKNLNLDLNNML